MWYLFYERFGSSLYLLEIIVLLDWLLADLKSSNFSHTIRSSKSINIRSFPSKSNLQYVKYAQVEGEPEFPACGPESPDCPDTPAQGPDTPSSKNFLYIYRGVGVKPLQVLFHHRHRLLPSLHLHSRPRGISTFHPSRTRQSLKEGSPPLRKLRGGVGFEVPALSRYFELRIAWSPNVVGFLERSSGHLFLACVGTFDSSFMQYP